MRQVENFKKIVSAYDLDQNNLITAELEGQLVKKSDLELCDRKNFIGHFTASAFIISKDTKDVLLVFHKALQRYVQPGGHIEIKDSSPLEAAKRELFEETKITKDQVTYHQVTKDPLVPFNIAYHDIPENKQKNEASHHHYDLQYLFLTSNDLDVMLDPNESEGYEWVSFEKFKTLPAFSNIANKIEELIEDK